MKLVSPSTELRVLHNICEAPSNLRHHLLARVSPTHFYHEPSAEAFKRLTLQLRQSGEIPDWSTLLSDPTISEDTRALLLESTNKPIKSVKLANSVLSTLTHYRKLRLLYEAADKTIRALKADKVEVDTLIEGLAEGVSQARSSHSEVSLVHIGRGNNCSELVRKLTSNETRNDLVPTGFRDFDQENGGFVPGSLVIIGATTGGGKSTLANQLLINMAERGVDTVIVPLEMTEEETMARILANLSGVDVGKFVQGKLTANEQRVSRKAFKDWAQKVKEQGARYSIYPPQEDQTIEEILYTVKPYGHKVILIDYLSLLKGVDGEDSWQQLGKAARFAKIFAKTHNCVVALLAQVSNEGVIRYSRAVLEHANNAWLWTYGDANQESGLIEIRQVKARNQKPFPFQLKTEFDTMRITNADGAAHNSTKKGKERAERLDSTVKAITDDEYQDISD